MFSTCSRLEVRQGADHLLVVARLLTRLHHHVAGRRQQHRRRHKKLSQHVCKLSYTQWVVQNRFLIYIVCDSYIRQSEKVIDYFAIKAVIKL